MKAGNPLVALFGRLRAALVAALVTAALAVVLPATASAAPPTVSLDPITVHSITTAHASGQVTVDSEVNGGFETFWCFEASPEGLEQWSQGTCGGPVAPSASESIEGDFAGLTAGKPYEVRISYLNFTEFATEYSAVQSFETDPATAPVLALGPATSVTGRSSHLAGSIDPEGGNTDTVAGLLPVSWRLQYAAVSEPGNWISANPTSANSPLEGAAAESPDPVDVEANTEFLIPNATYRYRLVAQYAGLTAETAEADWGEFTTEAVKPEIEPLPLGAATQTSIRLRGLVNPNNSPLTDCHFEYGVGGSFNQTAPCESKPEGSNLKLVGSTITNLTPGAEYSFRLIAANAGGTAEGDPRTFNALPEAGAESCSNESIRDAQQATALAECRAYEMASPHDKNGGDIAGEGETVIAGAEGNAVEFASRTGFAGTVGSAVIGQTQYLARRSGAGWSTHSITPMSRPDAVQVSAAATRVQLFSEDMSTAMLWGYDLPGANGGIPEQENIYVEDTATGAMRPVTSSKTGESFPYYYYSNFLNPEIWGLSADAKHVAFVSKAHLLPEAAAGYENVYLWNDGDLTLAGVLPDGSTPAEGSTITPVNIRGTVSADGSRVAFTSPEFSPSNEQQLYLRINGNHSVWVSEPENGTVGNPTGIAYQGMTPDGHNVYFVSESPLLAEDTHPGPDLYRWTAGPDPEAEENLTLISHIGNPGVTFSSGGTLIGMSDDSGIVYYHTTGGEIIVWDHGNTHIVASQVPRDGVSKFRLTLDATNPGAGRVSADGDWLAYMLGGQMYLYDLKTNTLACASCSPLASATDATVEASVTHGVRELYAAARPRFLSNNGKVFFSTAARLVPEDVNGIADTYEYDGQSGELHLLSTGKGGEPMMFADASSSGNDVFILTRQQLVPGDTDKLVDLYDIRTGGGFVEPAAQASSPCAGEACQGSSAPTSTAPTLSSSLEAAGNVNQRRGGPRCKAKGHRIGRKGRAHCAKKHHKHHGANSNRRASR